MNSSPASLPSASPTQSKPLPITLWAVALALLWTGMAAASFFYNISNVNKHALDSARIQGRTAFEKDVIYRRWNSAMKGVYVPVSDAIKPNPHLRPQGREIPLPDGRVLTLINPAYMTRLVHELGALDYSRIVGHITSTNPIRPQNEPDPWERQALEQIESGRAEEVTGLETMQETEYLRLMRGLVTEESCVPCHPDYTVGQIRGGISVSVPMDHFNQTALAQREILFMTHGGLWLFGLLGLGLGSSSLRKRLKERDKAEKELKNLTIELENRVAERTEDLRKRQRELDAFLDNANTGLFLKNADGQYLIANTRFAGILDRPLDRIIGRSNEDLLDGITAKMLREHEEEVIRTGRAKELKNAIVNKAGNRFSCFLFPIKEDKEAVVGVGGTCVDMTERDRVEAILMEARDTAEKANQAKTDFLANMSHEIRTPLNGLIGMADLLLRTRLTADQASMAAAIKTSGDSLLSVLNDVLDISKIAAGKLVLEQAPFLLRDMLYDAIRGLTPIAYKKQLELILHVSPQVPEQVVGDAVRLRQIILNLVNNALKFTDAGEVVVTVQLREMKDDSARLRFSVTDTGIGIPSEQQKKILMPFEQVDASTTRRYGGTGLGLTICSQILEIMGAKLQVKSSPGYGSSFWFEIMMPISNEMDVRKPFACSQALQGYRVLIVDDNETNLFVLHETLSQWGIEVTKASSMHQALELASSAWEAGEPFQIILTDLQMPSFDGVDLLNALKQEPHLASLPVILLTSGTLPVDVQATIGRKTSFSAALDKPVRPEALLRAMAAALNIWESYDIQQLQAKEITAAATGGEKTIRSLNILMAEDVEMNQMVATRMLKELGHKVTVVSDGKQAVEKACTGHYDAILMDIQMPVMDGVQATQTLHTLKRQGAISHCPVIIAMTAHALKGDREKYIAAGMDAYISKPILLEDLRKALQSLFGNEAEVTQKKNALFQMTPTWCTVREAKTIMSPARPDDGARSAEASANVSVSALSGAVHIPSTSATPDENVIDWAMLSRNFGNDSGFIIDSMNLYLRDAPNLFHEVVEAVGRLDNSGLTVNAHALKGITGYFTHDEAFNLCLRLENTGRGNLLPAKKDNAEKDLSALREMMEEMYAQMKAYIKEHGA